MKLTRVLIADSHPIVRRGLRTLLETQSGMEVCGEAANGQEAIEKTKQLNPDLILMDVGMSGVNGLEATRKILARAPHTRIVLLAAEESPLLARDVFKAGAVGFMLKSDCERTLDNLVRVLHRSASWSPGFSGPGPDDPSSRR